MRRIGLAVGVASLWLPTRYTVSSFRTDTQRRLRLRRGGPNIHMQPAGDAGR